MASSSGTNFQITITALDKATMTLRAIKKNIGLTDTLAGIRNVNRSLSNLARETGLPTLARNAAGALGHIRRLGSGITSFVLSPLRMLGGMSSSLGLLGGVASIGGIFEIAKSGAQSYADLAASSLKTGVDITSLARLRYAAKQSEVDPAALDKTMFMLNRNLAEAARGKNKDVLSLFTRAGIDIGGRKGHPLQTAAQLFPTIADAIMKNKNQALGSEIAMKLFGRSAEQIFPMLKRGSKGIAELGEEFKRLHGDVTPAQALIGIKAVESWRKLGTATDGLRDSIGIALAPALIKIITPLTNWVAKNRELIAVKVGKWAKEIGDYLQSVDWKKAGKEALRAFHDIRKIAEDALWAARKAKEIYDLLHGKPPVNPKAPNNQRWDGMWNAVFGDGKGDIGWWTRNFGQGAKPAAAMLAKMAPTMPYLAKALGGRDNAAALLGNLGYESRGFNPQARGDSNHAYGLAQWHAPRARDFAKWSGHSLYGSSADEQLRFAVYELTQGKYRNVLEHLRSLHGVGAKTAYLDQFYESPANPGASVRDRAAIAQALFSQPLAQQSGTAQAMAGGVTIDINHHNAPRGTRLLAKATGKNPPVVNIGRAWVPA